MELLRLIEIDVAVQPMVDLGEFPLGGRRTIVFDGGTFEGRDGLRGTIAPGGVDWQIVRPDGVIEIDAHYLLVTDDGEPIEVRSTGIRKASPDVAGRLARGEDVAPAEYYFRTHVRLSTSAPRLAFMNDISRCRPVNAGGARCGSTSTRCSEHDRTRGPVHRGRRRHRRPHHRAEPA